MLIQNFEDSQVWQKGQELAVLVYQVFRDSKDFGFRDQIQRAAVSISNNIAEGFERQTNKELIHFLYIAKGSCGEVRSMYYLAIKLGYINGTQFNEACVLSFELSKMLGGFIKSCK